jgi:hypothetical protein
MFSLRAFLTMAGPGLFPADFPGAVNTWNITGWNVTANRVHTFGPSAVLDPRVARNKGCPGSLRLRFELYFELFRRVGFASAGQYPQDTSIADTWQFRGNSAYNATETFTIHETANLENPNGAGSALASFLLGVPDSASQVNSLAITPGGWVDGAYVQDQNPPLLFRLRQDSVEHPLQ